MKKFLLSSLVAISLIVLSSNSYSASQNKLEEEAPTVDSAMKAITTDERDLGAISNAVDNKALVGMCQQLHDLITSGIGKRTSEQQCKLLTEHKIDILHCAKKFEYSALVFAFPTHEMASKIIDSCNNLTDNCKKVIVNSPENLNCYYSQGVSALPPVGQKQPTGAK